MQAQFNLNWNMANRRTLTKRDGQMKLLNEMIIKGQEILDGESENQKSKKEVVVLLKNIRAEKTLIDGLNEDILNTIEEEKMDDEMRKATDLDLNVDTQSGDVRKLFRFP